MTRYFIYVLIIIQMVLFFSCTDKDETVSNAEIKTDTDSNMAVPRIIISTDFPPLDVIAGKGAKPGDPPDKLSDPDDVQSMVRFLLYSNEFKVEALIASAGTFAMEAQKKNILSMLEQYGKVYDNLKTHDPRYPAADYLRSVTYEGKGKNHGIDIVWGRDKQPYTDIIGKGMDSEASNAIIAAVDKPDPRPVWICVWGGPREVAQAIWDVRNTRSSEELKTFISKLRVFLIAYQDATHGWLLENFPDMFIICSIKNYQGMFWNMHDFRTELGDLEWVNKNIRKNHGPLGAAYPRSGWDPEAPGVWEGDSPSFLHLVSGLRGVNDPEKPDQGGWGGKFVQPDPKKNHWFDDPMGPEAVYSWKVDYQEEFKQRADWMIGIGGNNDTGNRSKYKWNKSHYS